MYPALSYLINKDLDTRMTEAFMESNKAGVDFGAGIITIHPQLKKALVKPNQKREITKFYINEYYKMYAEELEEARIKADKRWKNVEKDFYKVTDKYFLAYPWPEGSYLAFLSVINCNPRFLENKTFQVFWKHEQGIVSVSAHEMLHFLFFDLFEKKFREFQKDENYPLELSELA